MIVDQLVAALGSGGVRTEPQEVAPHLEDWRGRYRGGALCVVLPRSTEEVAAVLAICCGRGVPVVPQGGNTGLSGGSVPIGEGSVVLSLARMNRILALDPLDGSMIVEAGTVLAQIHAAADAAGFVFPLTLGAEGSCQIGGNISTNAGGTGVVRYGNTRDLVLGLEVVLADGTVWDGLRPLRKNNSGYDLRHLFIGAEGTLGIVTRAALRLFPKPLQVETAWLAVGSAEQAVAFAARTRHALDTSVSAIELINDLQARLVVKHGTGLRLPLEAGPPFHLLLELATPSASDDLRSKLETHLAACLEDGVIADAVVATSAAQAASFWAVRHGVAHANRSEGMGITMDASVPVGAIAAFLAEADAAVAAEFPEAGIVLVSHLGDGNVHYIAMVSADRWAGVPDKPGYVAAVRTRINDIAVLHHRGSFSAEHGVGQSLTPEVARYKSAAELDLLRGVKALFDPKGILNPGKLLPA